MCKSLYYNRTWTATDECGNSASSSQTIIVNDTIKPQFIESLPTDITVCNDIPLPAVLHAADNCGSASVVFTESTDNQTIPGSILITRAWLATDSCGNNTSHTQLITVHPEKHSENNLEICNGASVQVGTHHYTETGNYVDTLPTIWGCDSIVNTSLVIRANFITVIDTSICNGEIFSLNGKEYTVSGNYQDTLSTFFDCDSILDIYLVVKALPNLNLHVDGNSILCANMNHVALISNTGLDQYVWYRDGVLMQGNTTNSISVTQGGWYQLTAFLNGCEATDSIRIIPSNECPKTDTITICIPAKTDTAFCVNSLIQLPDAVSEVSFCELPNPLVEVNIVDTTCLLIKANNSDALTDTFCLLYCNNIGLCDTLIVFFCSSKITVPPIAENDCIETIQNTAVSTDVTTNDYDPDGHPIIVSGIITAPLGGNVVINGNVITYTPQPNFCGKDTFWYELCDNIDGCDTASVCIEVNCECELPQVITPNGDGYNDALVIPCIMGIGSVKLSVWNRWGLPVYEDENYQNNWEGTYGGEPLPSGTYWYGIDFTNPDSGKHEKLANYLLIIK